MPPCMDTMSSTRSQTHVPPGFPPVTPFITVEDPDQLVNFAKAAFGAEELREQRGRTPDGKTMHAALRIEGCIIETGRASANWKAMHRPPSLCSRRRFCLCSRLEGRRSKPTRSA